MSEECERHIGQGTISIGVLKRCYGCWLEQCELCPLCGKTWDDPTECKKGEEE